MVWVSPYRKVLERHCRKRECYYSHPNHHSQMRGFSGMTTMRRGAAPRIGTTARRCTEDAQSKAYGQQRTV